MTKNQLIQAASRRRWYSPQMVEDVLNILLQTMQSSLENGEQVHLGSFGTFRVKHRNPRTGRNPHTGEAVPIPARDVVVFSPGTQLAPKERGK